MKPSETREVTLIGAGLAGSLLATLLARRGRRVAVYERRPDLRRVEISAGRSINLALANRGIEALERVRLMDLIRPVLIPMAGRMLHDEEGRLQFLPYGNKPHEVINSVSRGGLNALLMDAAEKTGNVTIHFERTCRGVDLEKREALIDGTRVAYEVLIGTDGSASAVRGSVARVVDEAPLEHGYKELSIPPAENGGFRMEKHALHIWPRGEYMLIALPNIDGSFTVTLFLPQRGPESFEALTDERTVLDLFTRRFRDAIPLIPNLIEDFFANPTGHLETIRCQPWSAGEVLVLGDAAHAIVPFHGQGMNAAFEDVSALDELLGRGDREWSEVFREFESVRKPNADAIATMALENYVEMRSSVREPKFVLKKELSFRLEERHPNRFIPRYSMVMFHSIPYAEAQRRGAIQERILDELLEGVTSVEEVDYEKADRLIEECL